MICVYTEIVREQSRDLFWMVNWNTKALFTLNGYIYVFLWFLPSNS